MKFSHTFPLCLLLLLGCKETKSENKSETIQENEALHFLKHKSYKYSKSKTDIPTSVLESLSSINQEPFIIGDSTNYEEISLSDCRILNQDGTDTKKYNRELHFVLFNDTTCLLAYTQGGIGTHDVIDYFNYAGERKHIRYTTTDELSDTIKLRAFLSGSSAHER